MMEPDFQPTSKVLKALSDPKRLRIVYLLNQQELTASKILEEFQISQPTLSHDMHVLVESGIVAERRSGKNVFYRVNADEVQALFAALADILVGKAG